MQQLLRTPSCLTAATGSVRDALENTKAGGAAAVQGGGGVEKKTGTGRKMMAGPSGGDEGGQNWAVLRILRINYLSSLVDLDLDLNLYRDIVCAGGGRAAEAGETAAAGGARPGAAGDV